MDKVGSVIDRLGVWREILSRPWRWLVSAPFAALAVFESVRDELPSHEWQEKLELLKLPQFLPDWSWETWALIALALLLIGTLEGSFQIIRAARQKRQPVQENNGGWARLTDADRATMSAVFADSKVYSIEIFHTPTADCIRLADDFYDFFHSRLGWTTRHRPRMAIRDLAPGVTLETIPDKVEGLPDRNMRERSGALLLGQALQKIGFPVTYGIRGGGADELTIHMGIGIKP